MISSRDMNLIVNQESEKTIIIGDKKQFKPIELGKSFEDIQKHINKDNLVNMQETVRFKSDLQKAMAESMNNYRYSEAVEKLDEAGKIKEITNNDERLKQIKDTYIKNITEGKSTLLITNTNKERSFLNKEIRGGLKERNLIGSKDHRITAFTPKNIDPIKSGFAESYDDGDKIILNSNRFKGEAYVIEIDKDANTVKLSYKDKYIEIKAEKIEESAVYSQEQKEFSIGDKIIFLKNDRKLNIANGEIGKIIEINVNKINILKNNGQNVTINTDRHSKDSYNYIDHAYAITNYKSQGQTTDTVIYSHNSETITNQESFYVASTRAREDTTIFTNSREMLNDQVEQKHEKISTLDFDENKTKENNIRKEEESEINNRIEHQKSIEDSILISR